MLRKVTFRAEKDLIERARKLAEANDTTLSAEFRRWLEQYVESPQDSTDFETLMGLISYARAGKTFTRDELDG